VGITHNKRFGKQLRQFWAFAGGLFYCNRLTANLLRNFLFRVALAVSGR
jgi:hypothetical protein